MDTMVVAHNFEVVTHQYDATSFVRANYLVDNEKACLLFGAHNMTFAKLRVSTDLV